VTISLDNHEECEKFIDDNKEYITNNFTIINIENIYGKQCIIEDLFNKFANYTFKKNKTIVQDEIYDYYINKSVPGLNIAKEINLYSYDGELRISYFMNNFKIDGEYKEYKNNIVVNKIIYINGQKV
jgi:hypothetical protein